MRTPEMRGAPITVVRKEGDVYIEANVEFTGKHANDIYPGTEQIDPATGKAIPGTGKTYAEMAYDSIMSSWNTAQDPSVSYNINGTDGNGKFLSNESLRLHTAIHGIDNEGNILGNPLDSGAKTVKINLDNGSLMHTLGASSHVFTIDPKDYGQMTTNSLGHSGSPISPLLPAEDPITAAKTWFNTVTTTGKNIIDAATSDQLERVAYNWSIDNPGQMWLYKPEDANHEFGHLLGLGDAYGADYRYKSDAPPTTKRTNDYGQEADYLVPQEDSPNNSKGDLMRGYSTVSDTDMAMMLDAWKTGEAQFFDKDPDKVLDTKQGWAIDALKVVSPGAGFLMDYLRKQKKQNQNGGTP